MPKLILIKHAAPDVDPAKPPHQWQLSSKGMFACEPLAAAVLPFGPQVLVTSREAKALATAAIICEKLSLRPRPAEGLHEHDRSNVPHMRSAEFISLLEMFFRRPNELVLGKETAAEVEARFRAAVDDVLNEHPDQNVAIVTHGTVMALYLAPLTKRPPFELWRQLGLPSFVVIDRASRRVESVVERI